MRIREIRDGVVSLRSELRNAFIRFSEMTVGGEPLAVDLARIEAALEVVGDGSRLAVDANGRFDLKTAMRYAEALEPCGLKCYEEPGDPLDYDLLGRVAAASATRIATGENLLSLRGT